MALIIESLTLAAPGGGDRAAVSQTVVMFVTVAGLLGLFFIAIVILARSRMRRQQSAERKRRPSPDPWSEAGRRVSPDDLHGPGAEDDPT